MTPSSPFQPGDLVASYFRDSGGDEQDLSVPQQQQHFLRWCKEHNLIAGETFTDLAKKGSSLVGREGFLRMIRHFRSGEAKEKGLVIWKYSRFSRDVDDSAFYRADLRRMGYLIHSLNDNIPEGPEGRFFEAAIDWMNQRFLEDLSTDVKRGLHHLVQTYGCVPGTPPRGFKRHPVQIGTRRDGTPHTAHKWIPDPHLIPLVQQAFQMRASGSTLIQIHKATSLYSSLNSYRTFFTNRIYIGILEFGDLTLVNYCKPFISMDVWDAVQKLNQSHAQARFGERHPKRANSIYLFSGFIYCARCGSPMNGNTVTRDNTFGRDEAYRCSRAKRRRDCTASRIPRQILEDQIILALRERILLPDNLIAINQLALTAQQEGEEVRTQRLIANASERKKNSNQIANLTRAIADSGHSQALLDQLASLEARRTELQAEYNQLQIPFEPIPAYSAEQLIELSKDMLAKLNHATPEQRRLILRALIRKIIVEKDTRTKTVRGLITYYSPPFHLPLPETGKGVIMLPTPPTSVGAPRYRQHFTIPFQVTTSR